ncbi:hypothetical protein BH09PSE2_BH09PSE2_09380 [soil metagenome]
MGVLIIVIGSLLAAATLLALSTAWVLFAAKLYRESKSTLFIQSGAGLLLALVLIAVGAGIQAAGH